MIARRLLFAFPLIFAPLALVAEGLTGSYKAQGRNPDGSAYSGAVRIEDGKSIRVFWKIGSTSYNGSGFQDGRVVVIDWGDKDPVVYVVMANGELHGTWGGGRALERLIPN